MINPLNYYIHTSVRIAGRTDICKRPATTFLSAVVGIQRGDRKKRRTEGRQTIRKRPRARKKVFSESDGEYVDFEEIKKGIDATHPFLFFIP